MTDDQSKRRSFLAVVFISNCISKNLPTCFHHCISSILNIFLYLNFRPGSLIVIFVLTFKRAVTEEQAIAILRKAADTGNLGSFEVDSSSITAISEEDFKSTPATTRPTPGNPIICSLSRQCQIYTPDTLAVYCSE